MVDIVWFPEIFVYCIGIRESSLQIIGLEVSNYTPIH
jgi:hypothetical protein